MKRIKQEEENKQNNPKKRAIKAARLIIVVFFLVLFLEIWVVNRLSTFGHKIQDIKDSQASLELENQILESQIAKQASLLAIESKASALGFDSLKNIEYIKPANNIASAR